MEVEANTEHMRGAPVTDRGEAALEAQGTPRNLYLSDDDLGDDDDCDLARSKPWCEGILQRRRSAAERRQRTIREDRLRRAKMLAGHFLVKSSVEEPSGGTGGEPELREGQNERRPAECSRDDRGDSSPDCRHEQRRTHKSRSQTKERSSSSDVRRSRRRSSSSSSSNGHRRDRKKSRRAECRTHRSRSRSRSRSADRNGRRRASSTREDSRERAAAQASASSHQIG